MLLRRIRGSGRRVLCRLLGDRHLYRLGSSCRQLSAQGTCQQALEVQPHPGADALGDLSGTVDDVAEELGAVALAVHGDLIYLAEGLRHVLGDLRQSVHDHLDDSGLAVLLHGLRLFVDTLGLCQGLGPDGFGFRLTHGGDAGSFLLLGETGSLGGLLGGFRRLLLFIADGFRVFLPLVQSCLSLLLLAVTVGVGSGADLRVQGLLLDLDFLALQLGFALRLGNLGIDGSRLNGALLLLLLVWLSTAS